MMAKNKKSFRFNPAELWPGESNAYSDIRIESMKSNSILCSGDDITDVCGKNIWGASIRTLHNGSWGKTAVSHPDDINDSMRRSLELAKAARGGNVVLAEINPSVGEFDLTADDNPEKISLKKKMALIREYSQYCRSFPWISTVSLMYSDRTKDKYFASTEGADILQHGAEATIWVRLFARDKSGRIHSASTGVGGSSSFSNCENRYDDLKALAEMVRDLTVAKRVSEIKSAGHMDVILDPLMTGLFIHEAFGHMSEADQLVENRSLREAMSIGRRVASEELSVVDDPGLDNVCGTYRFDDEGTPALRTSLIDRGVLSGRLHSRETAAAMGEKPTGNARAVSWRFSPIVRMSNIYAIPGKTDLKTLFRQLGDGIYAFKNRAGQTTGRIFTFSPQIAYMVRDGEICEPVRDVNLSGDLFDLLDGVESVSDGVKFAEGGACGKGEQFPLPCGKGGAHMIVRNVSIGG